MRKDLMPRPGHINIRLRIPEDMFVQFEYLWAALQETGYPTALRKTPEAFVGLLCDLQGTEEIFIFLVRMRRLRDRIEGEGDRRNLIDNICDLLERAIGRNQSHQA